MTPVQQQMAQGGSSAASEAAQAAAAAAAAVGNSTLFTHMAHIRGHEAGGGEINLSQDQSENIHGKLDCLLLLYRLGWVNFPKFLLHHL